MREKGTEVWSGDVFNCWFDSVGIWLFAHLMDTTSFSRRFLAFRSCGVENLSCFNLAQCPPVTYLPWDPVFFFFLFPVYFGLVFLLPFCCFWKPSHPQSILSLSLSSVPSWFHNLLRRDKVANPWYRTHILFPWLLHPIFLFFLFTKEIRFFKISLDKFIDFYLFQLSPTQWVFNYNCWSPFV